MESLPCRAHVQPLSHVQLFEIPWTAILSTPLPIGFSRQEYWSGLPFPHPGDLPHPGTESTSSALAGGFFTSESHGKPLVVAFKIFSTGESEGGMVVLIYVLCEPPNYVEAIDDFISNPDV